MDYTGKFILWCFRKRREILERDVDYLATNWRIRINREDILPSLEILAGAGLIRWQRIRLSKYSVEYFSFVLTTSGEKEMQRLPEDPQDISKR